MLLKSYPPQAAGQPAISNTDDNDDDNFEQIRFSISINSKDEDGKNGRR